EVCGKRIGEDTAGWSVGRLGEIADITSGKRPNKKEAAKSNEFPIPIIGASSVMGYTKESLYDSPILVIGRVGTHGVVQRFSELCWPSDNTLVITSKFYEFVYHILKSINYKNLNRGSTQPLITQTDIQNTKIIIPDTEILDKYEKEVGALMNYRFNTIIQSRALAAIRDALLPKLMSGEIEAGVSFVPDGGT
ncbi:MAG: restriction endonuclease subunit S, partial [Treponema sp.]|nr:restriction endonuclease subunit S [Treponema sp.]